MRELSIGGMSRCATSSRAESPLATHAQGGVSGGPRGSFPCLLALPVLFLLSGCASFMEDLENGTVLQMAQTGVAVMADGANAQNRRTAPSAGSPSRLVAAAPANTAHANTISKSAPKATVSPTQARSRNGDVQRGKSQPPVAAQAPRDARVQPQRNRPAPPAAASHAKSVASIPAAAPRASAQDAEKRKNDFLRLVASGVRMRAVTCPGGDGQIFATGTRPRPRPEVVSCVDVHYRARCDRSDVIIPGVATNFAGSAGCFGETYAIKPKPACAPERVRIEVVEARPCGD
ncbi:MAG TPA: hypothetical protein VEB23_17500 [Ramlibacter sp.]|nr:hypothetical protein [Ramlibacter sp.]